MPRIEVTPSQEQVDKALEDFRQRARADLNWAMSRRIKEIVPEGFDALYAEKARQARQFLESDDPKKSEDRGAFGFVIDEMSRTGAAYPDAAAVSILYAHGSTNDRLLALEERRQSVMKQIDESTDPDTILNLGLRGLNDAISSKG